MNRLIPIVLAGLLCACSASREVPRLEDGRVPPSTAYTHLVFRSYVGDVSVSIDGQRVYAFHDPQSAGRLTLHVVQLPAGNAGKQIDFETPHPPQQSVRIGAAYLATETTLPFALDRASVHPLREQSADIFLGILLFVVGAIACAASLIRRRGDALALRSFGAFTLLYGARLVAGSSLPFLFGLTWRTAAFAESFITYVIPIAAWYLPLRLIGNGWKSTLRLQVIAFTIFAPVGIISDLVTGRPLSLEAINNVLVVVGGLNILLNLLHAVRSSPELRIVLAGALVFLLFAFNNNVSNLVGLPWDYDDEAPGFVVFLAALGYAATRAFVRGERESLAIDNELKTAREIQQSILPRAMPDVEGLRFHAGYVPATSVGGDMYSFLSGDDGAGVLVADVAGHGVPAALIASMVKIAVSSQLRLAADPAALLGGLDAILRRDVRRAFVTATYLWFDTTQRRVAVANAGHPPPLLYRDGTFHELGGTGVLLGRFSDARYTATFTELLPGDRIVAYTDGIPEARNARDEMFGEERLKDAIRASTSVDEILAEIHRWRGSAVEDADDLTIVIRPHVALIALVVFIGCSKDETPVPPPSRPSILLVTLDTTRADAIGPDAKGTNTPAFNALAARARRFRYAYATAPQTLPSHSSMMTGLYPGGHGLHENSRYLGAHHPLAAEKLREAGYRTAAFVSAFPLARRFGLARGFETYDDEPEAGRSERNARATTDRALAWLAQAQGPVFLWVHYYDPHFPYVPTYRAEIESMDAELGRLVQSFEKTSGQKAVIVTADHGEGLGEHGEAEHGNLLYQGVMQVPLLIAAPGGAAEVIDAPVSTRRIFHTLLDLAGIATDLSLLKPANEVVVGEAMGPFLQYGWQPQIMAVEGRRKAIHAGAVEVYDVVADPAEAHDLGTDADLSREVRKALLEYPVPSLDAMPPPPSDDEERKRLASLGYIAADAKPVIRKDAPRPRDMAPLFALLDRASNAFVLEDYATAIPLLEQVLAADPYNITAALRIAAAQSALGRNSAALTAFRRAESIAPNSPDVRHYLALHYVSTGEWDKATPLLERVVEETPDRLPALEALAEARARQGRAPEALQLWRRVHSMRAATPAESARVGALAMATGNTNLAIESFERARQAQGPAFRHDLELGVLYLAARRFAEARDALDRVPEAHPEYPMALFKRAQVSVLLNEPDQAARIARARERADATTRTLIANEKLFGVRQR